MAIRTTLGNLLVNEALPEDLRDFGRVLDKKGLAELLRAVAQRHPDKYVEVSKRLADIGREASTRTGGDSFGLAHMRKSRAGRKIADELRKDLGRILDDDRLDDEKRNQLIVRKVGAAMERQMKEVYDESLAEDNPLAMQVVSGSRGNKMNLSSLRGADLLYSDQHENVIPLPVLRSYSEGLTPEEYWAGTYGARRGVVATKFATRDAGYLCLAAGTLVRMGDFGCKPIEDIRPGDVVLGADREGRTFPVRVNAVFDNGERYLYKFRFRYGKSRSRFVEVMATQDHKVLARHLRRNRRRPDPQLHKTVTVDQVRLGDCERRSVSFHSLVPPQGFVADGYGVAEPWAWFVGLLIGDGGLTTSHIGFSCADQDLLELLDVSLATHGFRLTPKGSSRYEYIIADDRPERGRNRLRSRLDELGLLGRKSPEKFIPDVVASWDNKSVAAMLRGIFTTDGGVATTSTDSMPFVRLGMTAKDVVYGVQSLLADRFGVYGQICKANCVGRPVGIVPGSFANHDIYSFTVADRSSIERFATRVGFSSSAKLCRLHQLLSTCSTADREDDFLFHFVDATDVGTGPTYDIEVDHQDHLFVLANGAIVSNSKQLNQLAHRLVVVGDDEDEEDALRDDDEDGDSPAHDNGQTAQQAGKTQDSKERAARLRVARMLRGMPVDVDDPDNEGALLAHDVGPYRRNTVLTPKILKHLARLKKKRIVVRSPIVGGSPDGGVYARDVGVREQGTLPGRGEIVGLSAAQAVSEPLSQGQLSAKHSGGVAGQEKAVSGFKSIDQQIQVPRNMKGGAAHASVDGKVEKISPAPAGGTFVTIGGKQHYVGQGYGLKVEVGDEIEAGDVLSEGIPDHATIVEHKGVGEGRRYFTHALRKSMKDAGMKADRRNIELIARGLINHVELQDEWGDYVEGDVVPYVTLERAWKPREGHEVLAPKRAKGQYLERPVLHYSVGTQLRPSVIRDLEEFGVKEVPVHKEPPPFRAHMVRGMSNLQHDPDWMTRMYGSGLKASLLDSVHHGAISDERGTSFVPGLAKAVGFGRSGGPIRQPERGFRPAEGVPVDQGPPAPARPQLPARPAPIAPQPAPRPATAGKGFSWSGLFKLSAARKWRRVKRADDAPKPAQPAKPATPSSPAQPAKPVQPAQPQTPSWAQPESPSIGAGQNPFAFHGGYQGHGSAGVTRDFRPAAMSGNLFALGAGLDAEAMHTLLGMNSRNGVVRQPGRYYQGISLPVGQGAHAMPGGPGGPGDAPFGQQFGRPGYFPQPSPEQNAPPAAARAPAPQPAPPDKTPAATPRPYAVPTATERFGWKPGNAAYDDTLKAMAQTQGVEASTISPAAVQKQLYDHHRFMLAMQRGGYTPGGSAHAHIKDDVVKEVLKQNGYEGDLPTSIAGLKEAIASGNVPADQLASAKQALAELERVSREGPGMDMVSGYVRSKGLVDPSKVADHEVLDWMRKEDFAEKNPWLAWTGEMAHAVASPAGQASWAKYTIPAAAAWHAGGYKLYNAVTGAAAKSPGVLKGVAQMKALSPLGRVTGLMTLYDLAQGVNKSHEERLDRFRSKTTAKRDAGIADAGAYLWDNVYNMGDNVGAVLAGAGDASVALDSAGSGAKRGKAQEAAQIILRMQRMEQNKANWTDGEQALYDQAKARLDALRQEEANSQPGVLSSLGRAVDFSTPLNSYLRPGDIDAAVQAERRNDASRARADAEARHHASLVEADRRADAGEDPASFVPGFENLWSDRGWTSDKGTQTGTLAGQARTAIGRQRDGLSKQAPSEAMLAALRLQVRSRMAMERRNLENDAFGPDLDAIDEMKKEMGSHAGTLFDRWDADVAAARQAQWQKEFGSEAMPDLAAARRRMGDRRFASDVGTLGRAFGTEESSRQMNAILAAQAGQVGELYGNWREQTGKSILDQLNLRKQLRADPARSAEAQAAHKKLISQLASMTYGEMMLSSQGQSKPADWQEAAANTRVAPSKVYDEVNRLIEDDDRTELARYFEEAMKAK